jgi:hypothetical protein
MKTLIFSFLLFISAIDSYGQWYTRKYNVSDINYLTQSQLEESFKTYEGWTLGSGLIAVIGGVLFFGSKNGWIEDSDEEDQTFFGSLWSAVLGEKGKNDVQIALGAGIMIGGTVAGLVCLGRAVKIKSVMNNNYPSIKGLNVSPAGIYNCSNRSFCPGVKLTYNF